jgi:hypothetical protein
MAEIAILLEKKGEHDEALKLLDEAQTLIKVDLRSESQSNAIPIKGSLNCDPRFIARLSVQSNAHENVLPGRQIAR